MNIVPYPYVKPKKNILFVVSTPFNEIVSRNWEMFPVFDQDYLDLTIKGLLS